MKIQYTLSDLFSCSVKIQYQQINKLEHQLESKKNQAEEPTSPALKSPQGTVTCEQLLYCAVQCAELLSPHLADHGTQLVALYLQPWATTDCSSAWSLACTVGLDTFGSEEPQEKASRLGEADAAQRGHL